MILKNLQDQGSSWASEVICCYSVVSRVTVRIYNNLMSKYLNWIFLPLAWQLLSIIPYLTSEYKMTIILKTLEINTAVILVSCNTFTTYLPSCNSLLNTLTSVCIFSTLFLIHFLRCWQAEFVCQSKGSFPGDHFLYSHDLNVWF